MSATAPKDTPPAGTSPVHADEFEAVASHASTVSTCSSPFPEVGDVKLSDKNVDEMKEEELKKEVLDLRATLGKALGQIESLRAEMLSMKNAQENWKSASSGRGDSPTGPTNSEGQESSANKPGQEMEIDNNFQNRYWTQEEHQRFLQALKIFGHKDVRAIAEYVGSRNTTQIRTHAQKYFKKLESKGQKLSDLGIPDRPQKSNNSPHASRRGSLKQSREGSPFNQANGKARKGSVSGELPSDAASLPGVQAFAKLNLSQLPAASTPAATAAAAAAAASQAQAHNPLLLSLLQQQQLQHNLIQQHQLLNQHLQRPQVSGVDVLALAALQQMQQSS